jgi:hypothetical protein
MGGLKVIPDISIEECNIENKDKLFFIRITLIASKSDF